MGNYLKKIEYTYSCVLCNTVVCNTVGMNRFFFYRRFLSRTLDDSQDSKKREGAIFYSYSTTSIHSWTFRHLNLCYCHVTYAFQSQTTLYSCLNVKELLAWNKRDMWSFSDCNGIRTHKHLVRKRTLNHLYKLVSLAKWLSFLLQTWLLILFTNVVVGSNSIQTFIYNFACDVTITYF